MYLNFELKTDSNGAIRGYSKAFDLKNTIQIPFLEDGPFLCNLCKNILNINIFISLVPQKMHISHAKQSVALKDISLQLHTEDETFRAAVNDNIELSGDESASETDPETPKIETVENCQFKNIEPDDNSEISSHDNVSESISEITIGVKNQDYPCDYCGTSFITRFARYHHYRKRVCSRPVERKRPPYSCEVCNKILKTRRGYLLHLKSLSCSNRTSSPTQLACSECQKTFKTKVGLRSHRFLHLPDDERPFKCEICKRGFATKLSFEIHELVHRKHFHTSRKNADEFT